MNMSSYKAKAVGIRGLSNFTEGKVYEVTPIGQVGSRPVLIAIDDNGKPAYVHAHRFTQE